MVRSSPPWRRNRQSRRWSTGVDDARADLGERRPGADPPGLPRQLVRRVEAVGRLPEHLVEVVAEHRLGAGVEEHDPAVGVGREDRGAGRRGDQPLQRRAPGDRLRRGHPLLRDRDRHGQQHQRAVDDEQLQQRQRHLGREAVARLQRPDRPGLEHRERRRRPPRPRPAAASTRAACPGRPARRRSASPRTAPAAPRRRRRPARSRRAAATAAHHPLGRAGDRREGRGRRGRAAAAPAARRRGCRATASAVYAGSPPTAAASAAYPAAARAAPAAAAATRRETSPSSSSATRRPRPDGQQRLHQHRLGGAHRATPSATVGAVPTSRCAHEQHDEHAGRHRRPQPPGGDQQQPGREPGGRPDRGRPATSPVAGSSATHEVRRRAASRSEGRRQCPSRIGGPSPPARTHRRSSFPNHGRPLFEAPLPGRQGRPRDRLAARARGRRLGKLSTALRRISTSARRPEVPADGDGPFARGGAAADGREGRGRRPS